MSRITNTILITLSAVLLSAGIFHHMSSQTSMVADSSSIATQFEQWRKLHNRKYASPREQLYRLKVFTKNLLNIIKRKQTAEFKVGINRFADMTPEEFRAKYTTGNSFKNAKRTGTPAKITYLTAQQLKDTPTVDWRTKGAVTPIKTMRS